MKRASVETYYVTKCFVQLCNYEKFWNYCQHPDVHVRVGFFNVHEGSTYDTHSLFNVIPGRRDTSVPNQQYYRPG